MNLAVVKGAAPAGLEREGLCLIREPERRGWRGPWSLRDAPPKGLSDWSNWVCRNKGEIAGAAPLLWCPVNASSLDSGGAVGVGNGGVLLKNTPGFGKGLLTEEKIKKWEATLAGQRST